MSYASIYFILQKTGKPDDLLKITPNAYDYDYIVHYNQKYLKNSVSFYADPDSLKDYLYNFLTGLAYDSDGPEFLQVEVPGHPCTLLKLEDYDYDDLADFADHVVSNITLLEGLTNWPAESNTLHS